MTTPKRPTYAVEAERAYISHEEARNEVITAMLAANEAFAAGNGVALLECLLAAQFAIGRGLIWSDVLGVGDAGWRHRQHDVDQLRDLATKEGHARRLFAHSLVASAMKR